MNQLASKKMQFAKLAALIPASPPLLSEPSPFPKWITKLSMIGHHVAVDATWYQEAMVNFKFPPASTFDRLEEPGRVALPEERMPTRGVIREPFLPSHDAQTSYLYLRSFTSLLLLATSLIIFVESKELVGTDQF
jgi:hypothetical protein